MDERITPELRLSLSRARRYALFAGTPRVVAAHLEQAVLHQPLGRGARLWRRLGGTVPKDPAALPHPSEEEAYPWANDALRLLERASDQRRWMNEDALSGAHVLLAALRDPESWTGTLAKRMGRLPEDLLDQALKLGPSKVTETHLREALEVQWREGGRLGDILLRLGYVDPEEIATSLAVQYGFPVVDLDSLSIPPETLALLPGETAWACRAVPIKLSSDALMVAVENPFALDDLRSRVKGLRIEPVLASEEAIRRALERAYPLPKPESADPTRKLLDLMLDTAIRAGGTDLHLELFEEVCKVRYRVDGVLYEMESLPRHLAEALVARIKDLAGMELGLKVPQLGWIDDPRGEIECSTLPTVGGESLVLILPRPPR